MAKPESIEKLVAKAMPGMKVVQRASIQLDADDMKSSAAPPSLQEVQEKAKAALAGVPEMANPFGSRDADSAEDSLESIRKRFFKTQPDAAAIPAASPDTETPDDVEVIQVASEKPVADDVGNAPPQPNQRTVIVSKSKGVLGTQG